MQRRTFFNPCKFSGDSHEIESNFDVGHCVRAERHVRQRTGGDNGHMIEMQKLTKNFEAANPDIKVKWVTLEEGVLRQRVTTDIATKGGQFDVMTIGMYETPIWGKKGWLTELKGDAKYDADDILPAMKNGLSVDGKMYAAPFYGESSMLMYRKDLADKAGVKIADKPTRRTACTASACAASRAGATTWP
jgi:ABC-type glycerol-3-phosphate transport system substrate-binding protein